MKESNWGGCSNLIHTPRRLGGHLTPLPTTELATLSKVASNLKKIV